MQDHFEVIYSITICILKYNTFLVSDVVQIISRNTTFLQEQFRIQHILF